MNTITIVENIDETFTKVVQAEDEFLNFEVRGKNFKPGWYTCENFNGIPTFWLVYEDSKKYTTRINNCGLMLQLFKELPLNATINAHKKPTLTEQQKQIAWSEFEYEMYLLNKEDNY